MRTAVLGGMLAWLSGPLAPAAAGDLYGIDIGPDNLLRINRDSAESTVIGPTGVDPLNGMAYDPARAIFYAVHPNKGLYEVSPFTGASHLVGPIGGDFKSVNGLAYDPVDHVLYATDNHTNSILKLDPDTGAGSLIGGIGGGFTDIEGLGYDAGARVLYGITAIQRRVVTIDVGTGVAAPIPGGQLPNTGWRGLEFDPERKVLFASAGAKLYTIDPATGASSFVGTLPGIVQGLAVVSACYADCQADGGLDLFDYLCFVNKFNGQDPGADCDGQGGLDLFDFLCYTNKFNAGCE